MPRTAAMVTYADFTANCDAAAVVEALEAAPNRDAVSAVYQELVGVKVPPTAFYNLSKSLQAIRDGKGYAAGSKEYGNPTGESDHSKLNVPLQGGLNYAGINSLAAAYADKGKALYPVKDSNGSETPSAPPSAAAPATGSTPSTSNSGPMPVDPVLVDTVKALAERFSGPDADPAAAPTTGRAFLEMLWNETPEDERNRRVNAIARSFVETRESASRRGELRTMIDSLSRALKDDGTLAADVDIWTYIYNRALPTEAQSESYEQIKTNLRNAYRFDPDAATFRDWESAIAAYATLTVGMFSKEIAESLGGVDGIVRRASLTRTRETLDSILAGMVTAQNRFNEWETRNLRSATPPPPVVEKVAYADLPEAFRSQMPDFAWEALAADAQRTILAQRSIVQVDGVWTLAADRNKVADGESGK